MLTLKLYRGHTIKLISVDELDVFAVGEGNELHPLPSVLEISAKRDDKQIGCFFLHDNPLDRPKHLMKTTEYWDKAYVVNDEGKTVDTIKPY